MTTMLMPHLLPIRQRGSTTESGTETTGLEGMNSSSSEGEHFPQFQRMHRQKRCVCVCVYMRTRACVLQGTVHSLQNCTNWLLGKQIFVPTFAVSYAIWSHSRRILVH